MLYGALPGTETAKLSVPHQNPGGPSPAGAALAALSGMSRSVARQAASPPRVSHDRFIVPPRNRLVVGPPLGTPRIALTPGEGRAGRGGAARQGHAARRRPVR